MSAALCAATYLEAGLADWRCGAVVSCRRSVKKLGRDVDLGDIVEARASRKRLHAVVFKLLTNSQSTVRDDAFWRTVNSYHCVAVQAKSAGVPLTVAATPWP